MMSGDEKKYPHIRKTANIVFDTLKSMIDKELENENMVDFTITEKDDKKDDITFRKELEKFPDENVPLADRKYWEKYASGLKVYIIILYR